MTYNALVSALCEGLGIFCKRREIPEPHSFIEYTMNNGFLTSCATKILHLHDVSLLRSVQVILLIVEFAMFCSNTPSHPGIGKPAPLQYFYDVSAIEQTQLTYVTRLMPPIGVN